MTDENNFNYKIEQKPRLITVGDFISLLGETSGGRATPFDLAWFIGNRKLMSHSNHLTQHIESFPSALLLRFIINNPSILRKPVTFTPEIHPADLYFMQKKLDLIITDTKLATIFGVNELTVTQWVRAAKKTNKPLYFKRPIPGLPRLTEYIKLTIEHDGQTALDYWYDIALVEEDLRKKLK